MKPIDKLTKAELVEEVGRLSSENTSLLHCADELRKPYADLAANFREQEDRLQQVAQEKADLQSELDKALKINEILATSLNYISREVQIAGTEIGRLEGP